jgi:hypothetical protein
MSNIKVIDYLKKKINENIRTREEIEQILQNIKEKNKNNDISKLDSDSAHIYNKILDEIFEYQDVDTEFFNDPISLKPYVAEKLNSLIPQISNYNNNIGGSRHRKSHKHRKSTKKGLRKRVHHTRRNRKYARKVSRSRSKSYRRRR